MSRLTYYFGNCGLPKVRGRHPDPDRPRLVIGNYPKALRWVAERLRERNLAAHALALEAAADDWGTADAAGHLPALRLVLDAPGLTPAEVSQVREVVRKLEEKSDV